MIFKKNNKLNFNRKYLINGIECQPLFYDKDKEIFMLKEDDGNLSFILGDFKVEGDKIIGINKIGYTVNEKEMLEYIDNNISKDNKNITDINIIDIIQKKYYSIPTTIAKVIAEWYMM